MYVNSLSISFVEILLNKFDVVVANPPYTDSGSYGKELKRFMEANYRKPLAFHTNHYATFLKRNAELLNENGKIGMVTSILKKYLNADW
ncbi:MAG: N-6 DNA methylase [bacterium]|nr:N-6 DNA methylase [bacterium]